MRKLPLVLSFVIVFSVATVVRSFIPPKQTEADAAFRPTQATPLQGPKVRLFWALFPTL